jgi:hypothetical protein
MFASPHHVIGTGLAPRSGWERFRAEGLEAVLDAEGLQHGDRDDVVSHG